MTVTLANMKYLDRGAIPLTSTDWKAMDKEAEEFMGRLEDMGILEWYGISDEGEAMFKMDMKRLQEEVPELYDNIIADVLRNLDEDMFSLWEKGLVDVVFDEDGEPGFKINDEGIEFLNRDSD